MSKSQVCLVCALVLSLGGGLLFSADEPEPNLLPQAELSTTIGGGCQHCIGDVTYCTGVDCRPLNGFHYYYVGTGVTKRWCAGITTQSGVCNCNQTGLPNTVCFNVQKCTVAGCAGCGTASPQTYVKTACALDGATCAKDADCGG